MANTTTRVVLQEALPNLTYLDANSMQNNALLGSLFTGFGPVFYILLGST